MGVTFESVKAALWGGLHLDLLRVGLHVYLKTLRVEVISGSLDPWWGGMGGYYICS